MQYLASLAHPEEVVALLRLKYARSVAPDVIASKPDMSPNLVWCYDLLNKTSRSFVFVIQELGQELRDVICVFYLVLRGLDTIEDDMAIPLERKIPLLTQFQERLYQPGWNARGCGEGDERHLVENFDKVIDVFLGLQPKFQRIVADITRRMGAGMSEFSQRPVVTLADWDLYCHYVAGLVGIGLSNLFAASELEDQWFATADAVSNSMGLFLQKTNIIRDYLEDINQNRIFYPKDVWQKYTTKLENFKEPQYAKEAVYCLNDLITNAFNHVPDCLDYLSRLREKKVFNFCAIPQLMAVATLSLCYDNHNVFTGVVKIRRGQNAKMILDIYSRGMQAVYEHFLFFTNQLAQKIKTDDPNAKAMWELVHRIRDLCQSHVSTSSSFGVSDVVAVAALAASSAYLFTRHNNRILAKL